MQDAAGRRYALTPFPDLGDDTWRWLGLVSTSLIAALTSSSMMERLSLLVALM